MANMSKFLGGQIKSIQRGSINMASASSATATLSPAVDTSKTIVTHLGGFLKNGATQYYMGRLELTNTTTITCIAATILDATSNIVNYQIVEYY